MFYNSMATVKQAALPDSKVCIFTPITRLLLQIIAYVNLRELGGGGYWLQIITACYTNE